MKQALVEHGDATRSDRFTEANYRDYLKTLALIQIVEELQGIRKNIDTLNNVGLDISDTLEAVLGVDSGDAVSVQLIPGGITMSTTAPNTGTMSVDYDAGTVTIQYTDDKGDTNAVAPADASVSFSSDTPSVLAVAVDASNPLQGDLTPAAEGTANISASGLGTAPDGTAFSVDPIAITVTAGEATGASFVLSEPQATPAPLNPPAPTEAAQTVYSTTNDPTTIVAADWPLASVTESDGTPLYNYAGDSQNADGSWTQNGSTFPGWTVYTGAVVPAAGS